MPHASEGMHRRRLPRPRLNGIRSATLVFVAYAQEARVDPRRAHTVIGWTRRQTRRDTGKKTLGQRAS